MSSLTPEENQVLVRKYESPPFSRLSEEDTVIHTAALLVKIAVITGWVIADDESQDVLADQFRKLILEKYPNCNPSEIEYAFRTYGTTVKDWGKQMNLALIDEVMIPYMNRRFEISRHEESQRPLLTHTRPASELSDEEMEKWLSETKGQNLAVEFLPVMLYDWLVEKGKLTPTKKEKWEQMAIAIAYTHQKLSTLFANQMTAENRDALSRFTKMKEAGEFEPEEAEKLRLLSKKMLLYNYLKSI